MEDRSDVAARVRFGSAVEERADAREPGGAERWERSMAAQGRSGGGGASRRSGVGEPERRRGIWRWLDGGGVAGEEF